MMPFLKFERPLGPKLKIVKAQQKRKRVREKDKGYKTKYKKNKIVLIPHFKEQHEQGI